MGEVTLTINANVQGAVQGTQQISQNLEKINAETVQYRDRASQAFKDAATSAKTLARGINENEKPAAEGGSQRVTGGFYGGS